MPGHFTILLRECAVIAVIWALAPLPGELSARTIVVNGLHALASDKNYGSEAEPLKTISSAAQLAQPGDLVLVRAGIYRERVAPARGGTETQPIIYMAAPGEQVVIKGSDVWQPAWERISDQSPLYRGALATEIFARQGINPYRTPLKAAPGGRRLTLGQLFVDGRPLREVDSLAELTATPATWLVAAGGKELMVHFPAAAKSPGERLVELTTRDRIFAPHRRGLGYLQVRGFTMEHCANQFPDRFWESDSPQAGALGCRAGHHWLIEGNTVRFSKSIGIDCGYEGRHDLEGNQPATSNSGHHVIRNNHVTDNGCCGIAGMRSIGTRIIGNVIERNNWNHHLAPETGGIKLHYFVDGRIEGNLVRENAACGIWLDNVYRNARVSRNLVVGNRGPAVFVELGAGPLRVDNNVLANSQPSLDPAEPRADGLYTHDASGIEFVHNLVFGCDRFGSFQRKLTNRPGAGSSRIALRSNIFLANKVGHVNLPYPGPDARENRVEQNLFSAGGEFLVTPSGKIPTRLLIAIVEKATGVRPKLWHDTAPMMNLAEWQKVMSGGWRNAESEFTGARLSSDLVLTLDAGNAAELSTAAPSDGIEKDFFGDALPQRGAMMGPFQRLTRGVNTLQLWPLSHGSGEETIAE